MPKEIAGVTLFTLAEVADELGVSIRTAYTYVKNYQDGTGVTRLRAQRIGGKWYISEANLQGFLQNRDESN
jgi:transposase